MGVRSVILGKSSGSPNSFVMGNNDVSEGSLGARVFAKDRRWIGGGSAAVYHTERLASPKLLAEAKSDEQNPRLRARNWYCTVCIGWPRYIFTIPCHVQFVFVFWLIFVCVLVVDLFVVRWCWSLCYDGCVAGFRAPLGVARFECLRLGRASKMPQCILAPPLDDRRDS